MGTTPGSRRSKYQIQFQPLMSECRDMVIVYTNALLSELFTHADTALLDFAKKAESNELQNRFFEAINEIKSKRPVVEKRFRERISHDFDQFWSPDSNSETILKDSSGKMKLELVAVVQMDETVAIENMTTRTELNNAPQLYALGQRLAVINGGDMLKQDKLPSCPHHLVSAFHDAISLFNINSKIRLIILALFNRCVLKQLDSLYEDINNTLKDSGVLPHLRPTISKTECRYRDDKVAQAERSHQPEKRIPSEELGEELFASILDLLGAKRKNLNAGKEGAKTATKRADNNRPSGVKPTQPIKQEELISAIQAQQTGTSNSSLPSATEDLQFIPNIEIDEQFLQRIKNTLVEERSNIYTSVGHGQIDTLDEDTIDLVGMLFEYMLNDPILPNVAKALISYLHTPYLKATILDRSMLTNTQHVSRRLLDSLVEAGSHWVDESNLKRGIYPEMQIVVDRILKEFNEDLSLFDELFVEFRGKIQHFKQKTEVLEKRAQEAAMGREKLNIAKQRAQQEIKARLYGAKLPRPIKEFLLQSWTDKLIFTLLRHPEGELSLDWKDALRLADDLVWVFEPKTTPSEVSELAKLLPSLRQSVKDGLASLGGYNLEQGQAIFDLLNSPESVTTTSTVEPHADEDSAPSTQKVGSKTLAVTASSESTEGDIPEAELAMMSKVREVKFGTWFEIMDSKPGTIKRVRLSWLSPLTATCMFVDRAGIQTAIKPLRQLAQELLDGRSKLLEESSDPFVERTLHAIKKMLKRSLSKVDQITKDHE
ncbi:MAG: DUF1631 domain-containing protein [Candidatus Polarisedimenticolaceae bacterium]|nr:DUF1631 domain-containing protein [Candidatus Polarisedimenticolaceae bacterium]